jgi:hypothetical protein
MSHSALENSKKDLEKLQNTHEEDLKLIENLRKDHDKSSKVVEDLRAKNVDLAKTLSSKEQKIRDLEKALADREESSGKEVAEIKSKLELLFEEYRKALREFRVLPSPLPVSEEPTSWAGLMQSSKLFLGSYLVLVILLMLSRWKAFKSFFMTLIVPALRSFVRNLRTFLMPPTLQKFVPMKMF